MSRVVVVTGGAKGIGRAVAGAFAALGDRVVALGRDQAALAELGPSLGLAGHTVETHVCDVADERQVARTFEAVGPVDVLVNNAGIAHSAPLGSTTLEAWERHLAVNATGTRQMPSTSIGSSGLSTPPSQPIQAPPFFCMTGSTAVTRPPGERR